MFRYQSYVTIITVVQELVHAMACGHCFHEVCISAFADSRLLTLHTVPCPVCKKSRQDLAAEGDQLLSGYTPVGTGSSGSGGPVPEIDLVDEASDEVDEVDDVDDVEDFKGKGNAKGKATGNGRACKGKDEADDG